MSDASENDEEERNEVMLKEEALKDLISKLSQIDRKRNKIIGIHLDGIKTRMKCRADVRQARENKDIALEIYRKALCDKYESQMQTKMQRLENDLDHLEFVLKNLQTRLAYYECGDDGAHLLAKSLKRLSHLRVLKIPKNDIGAMGIKSLSKGLPRSSNLISLDLSVNPFGLEGAEFVANILKRCEHLEELNLHSCKLGPKGVEIIVDAIGQHSPLLRLNLRNNELGVEGVTFVAHELISKNYTLEELDLATNEIPSIDVARTLSDALSRNKTLSRIDLSYTKMDTLLRKPENRMIQLSFKVQRVVGIWPEFKVQI